MLQRVLGFLLVFTLATSALAASPNATPSTPPTLPGKGGRVTDTVYGATIIQLTDATDGTFNSHSYSSRSAFNYNNTYVLLTLGGTYKVRAFNPTTLVVGGDTTIPTNLGILEPMIWDQSGSRNTRLYGAVTSAVEANRFFWYWNVGDANQTQFPNSDFHTNLQVAGTVASATSSTSFTLTITEPITDMTQEFFVNQTLAFTSGVNNGLSSQVTAFNHATGAMTVAAFGGATPGVGDTVYVAPRGYNNQFDASPNGRYLALGVAHEDGQGQDDAHILVVYDTQTQAITRVRYFSQADYGGNSAIGIHRLGFDRTAGSTKIWVNLNGNINALLLYDFSADTVTFVNSSPQHEDASADSRLVQPSPTASDGSHVTRTTAAPSTTTTVYTPPTKTYSGRTSAPMLLDNHDSWTNAVLDSTHFFISGSLSFSPALVNTGWVSDTAPVYRYDNYLLLDSRTLHLANSSGVNDNLGEVWDGAAVLTYKGNAKANITGSGQWAYDPTGSAGNGQLWVRGSSDEDLTLAGNSGIVAAFDWRVGQDEIVQVNVNTGVSVQVCKTYDRDDKVGGGVTNTNGDIRGSASPDGKFVVFTSTWGNRQRVDVFAVQIGLSPVTTPPWSLGVR